jgi:hypothetical protein
MGDRGEAGPRARVRGLSSSSAAEPPRATGLVTWRLNSPLNEFIAKMRRPCAQSRVAIVMLCR